MRKGVKKLEIIWNKYNIILYVIVISMVINYEKFDLDFYLYMNDNLDIETVNNKETAYADYVKNKKHRILEIDNSIIKNFDPLLYLLCNKDLKVLNIKNLKFAEYHYLKFGKKENRISSVQEIKKILKDFNWIEYIYLNKKLINKFNNETDCIKHYLLFGIKYNKPYKTDKIICDEFNWIIYTTYYYDLNYIKTEKDAFEHYIKYGIDQNRNEWINLKKILFNIDENEYKKMNPELKMLSKEDLIYNWLRNDKDGKILITKNNEIKMNNEFCIAISVYSDQNTPKERLYASIKCLNYLFLTVRNCKIFIIIDGSINNEHLKFIKNLKKVYTNCTIYKNEKNYGISITKNICLNILNNEKDIKYFCLLDDDIFIKDNFIDFSIDLLEKYDIPMLTNFNKGLPYFENQFDNKILINSKFFLGNILIFSKKYFDKFGYFREFPYKWGEEHQEFTKRYLRNSNYSNVTIDFRKYLNDEFIVNNISTLHLHSCSVDHEKVKLNKEKYYEYIQMQDYVDFDYDDYYIDEI
jgi:hypothetical protein